jgi:AmmeMemoRadiSam system protein B
LNAVPRVLAHVLVLVLAGARTVRADDPEPYPLFFEDAAPFRTALAVAERDLASRPPPGPARIRGITVPHHLLAADLIALGVEIAARASADHPPERILLLTPDHFRRSPAPAATTRRSFRTPLGDVPTDGPAVRRFLEPAPGESNGGDAPLVAESNLFSHEHGVQAVLPFLARRFPGVPVLPVALHVRSGRAEWARIAERLAPLVTARTLIVQSTDFSHYLPQPEAARRDQETLRVLAAGNPDDLTALDQPAHLDSKAAQWIQMTLQARVLGCGTPVIVDNRNAIRYGGRPTEPRTTSYIVQLFGPDPVPAAALPGDAWFFGGDTHFGRHLAAAWNDPERAARMRQAILRVTRGAPLVLNLEGVLLERPDGFPHPMRLGMDAASAVRELRALGVRAVSLENNHTLDHGPDARRRMRELLRDAGIQVAEAGPPLDLGVFRLGAATDVVNRPEPAAALLTEQSFDPWRGARPPLFAFLHFGREYEPLPGERERQVADWAERAGAGLVLGAHPHRPSPDWERTPGSLRRFSLGNLVFDQLDPANGGGLVEVRFFEQGTWAARWHPLGNLYASSREPPAPHFVPPPHLAEDLGDFRSPLRFADGTVADTPDAWARRRAELRSEWMDRLGPWPPLITDQDLEFLETVPRDDGLTQHLVRFRWTPAETTTGHLLVPPGPGPFPAVITVYYEPDTAIGRGQPDRDFALQLARRGFVALSIGTTEASAAKTYALYHPSLEAATVQPLSMLAYAAANAWHVLARRPEVDPQRIGITGHSFGGKWALFASCLFDGFACAAWSDPGIVFDDARPSVNYWEPWYLGYHPPPWRPRGMVTAENPARGLYPGLRVSGRDLHELHALMAPRPFLVSGGSEDPPERWRALNHSRAVNRLLGFEHRVAMTNRPDHAPNPESNAALYAFFEHFLGPGAGTGLTPAGSSGGTPPDAPPPLPASPPPTGAGRTPRR